MWTVRRLGSSDAQMRIGWRGILLRIRSSLIAEKSSELAGFVEIRGPTAMDVAPPELRGLL